MSANRGLSSFDDLMVVTAIFQVFLSNPVPFSSIDGTTRLELNYASVF